MDELTFRRQFLSDPNTQDPSMLEHKDKHDAAWCDDVLLMESQLTNALAVPVPPKLQEKLHRAVEESQPQTPARAH